MRYKQKFTLTLVAISMGFILVIVSLLTEKDLTMAHVYLLSTIFLGGIGGNVAAKASQGLGEFFSNWKKEKEQ